MKVILISPSAKHDAELSCLLHMFEQGLSIYHLRKTNFSSPELVNFISEIPVKYHGRIVLHTHHKLALKFGLKGVYISRAHKKRKIKLWLRMKWLKFRKSNLQVSTTLRNIEDLLDFKSIYDYVLVSPVFDSISGNFQAEFSYYNLKYILQNTKYKVIARGGLSADTIQKARELGFAGAAFYSSIWKTKNPLQEFMKVKEKFNELKIPME